MPKTFTYKMKWIDWEVMLINFHVSHPIRNVFSLNYVVRDTINPIASNKPKFLYDYNNRTPLQGEVFTHDATKVHSYIICLISENNVAEKKVLPHKDNANGR